jgi:hypothetical protein
VGEWLGLPIGLVNIAGRTSLYTDKFEVSGHAYERTLVRTNIDPLAWKFEADFGMAMLEVALGLGEGTAKTAEAAGILAAAAGPDGIIGTADDVPNDAGPDGIIGTADDDILFPDAEDGNDLGFVLNIPEIGPAAVEVWYLSKDNGSLNGILGADVNVSGAIPFVDFAGGFKWDTRGAKDRISDAGPDGVFRTADDTVEDEWAWGAGVMVTYMMAELGVSANGNDSDTLNQLGVDLDVDPMQTGMWGFTGAVGFFADPASGGDFAYQGVELSAWLMVNAATLRAGYAITEDGYCYTCSVAGTNGGLFAVADIDW